MPLRLGSQRGTYTLRFAQDWLGDAETERKRGVKFGRAAIAKGSDDAEALAMGGYAVAFLGGEHKEGMSAIERSISLNPNSAFALANAGWVRCFLGQAEQAIGDFERSIRRARERAPCFACKPVWLLLISSGKSSRRLSHGNGEHSPVIQIILRLIGHWPVLLLISGGSTRRRASASDFATWCQTTPLTSSALCFGIRENYLSF